jgi:hypothetical protein
MTLESICTPALIYLVFSIIQIILDTGNGLYNTAILKLFVTFIFTIFLNYLCERGLGVISWVIVFIPFILMSIIISILLLMLGLDPTTGKLKINDNDSVKQTEDLRKSSAKIPIQPIIYSKPAELQTPTSLLKNLEDDLKGVDYSAYKVISELDKEVSGPYPPEIPKSSVHPPYIPRPPVISITPPVPNTYNVKNSAPFVNDGEAALYNKLTPENKKIFDNLPSNVREKMDDMYLIMKPDVAQVNNFPADKLNEEFIKFANQINN